MVLLCLNRTLSPKDAALLEAQKVKEDKKAKKHKHKEGKKEKKDKSDKAEKGKHKHANAHGTNISILDTGLGRYFLSSFLSSFLFSVLFFS